MNTIKSGIAMRRLILILAVAITITPPATLAQTPIKLHSNKFSTADDVKLGRQAAAEAEQKIQLMRDPQLAVYIERVGKRLTAAIPPEFQHPEFQYYSKW
jgi:predicted Zn-dependent protease